MYVQYLCCYFKQLACTQTVLPYGFLVRDYVADGGLGLHFFIVAITF
jgi:hypothetical protein